MGSSSEYVEHWMEAWNEATRFERRAFLEDIGPAELLAVMSPAMLVELDRRVRDAVAPKRSAPLRENAPPEHVSSQSIGQPT